MTEFFEADTDANPSVKPALDLLVWDAPNVDMTLAQVTGTRPGPESRPRFDAVGRWFVTGAGDRQVEACVFANVPPASAVHMRGWVEAIRAYGFSVFARPKLQPADDIDDAMLEHIADRVATHRVVRLIIASGDGRNFREPVEALARDGVDVTILSFAEVAGYGQDSDLLHFVDLEDVPGVFTAPLNRTRLDSLPVGGAWLAPTGSLRDL